MNPNSQPLPFGGLGVALVTPFTTHNTIDYQTLEKLIAHLVADNSVNYLVVLGSTGEAALLDSDEKRHLVQFVASRLPVHIPLVLGIGGNNTAEVINDIKQQDWHRIDAVLLSVPYYIRPTQAGITSYFTILADALPVPVIMYNVPSRTGANMLSETVLQLATYPNIIGIKEASGNMEQCLEILANQPANFQFLSGDDLLALPLMAAGAGGVISVLGNLIPKTFGKMVHLSAAGNYAQARILLHQMVELNGLMYAEGNPAGVKAGLELRGFGTARVRLPLMEASEELKKRIGKALGELD